MTSSTSLCLRSNVKLTGTGSGDDGQVSVRGLTTTRSLLYSGAEYAGQRSHWNILQVRRDAARS
jgi:hypothetical protein